MCVHLQVLLNFCNYVLLRYYSCFLIFLKGQKSSSNEVRFKGHFVQSQWPSSVSMGIKSRRSAKGLGLLLL